MMRYLPPKGTAGFAVFSVSVYSRLPCPPARSIATHSFFWNIADSSLYIDLIDFIFLGNFLKRSFPNPSRTFMKQNCFAILRGIYDSHNLSYVAGKYLPAL
jgi:hypothetical protein